MESRKKWKENRKIKKVGRFRRGSLNRQTERVDMVGRRRKTRRSGREKPGEDRNSKVGTKR